MGRLLYERSAKCPASAEVTDVCAESAKWLLATRQNATPPTTDDSTTDERDKTGRGPAGP